MPQSLEVWNASPAQVERFANETALMPAVVLDAVVDEVIAVAADHPQAASAYETLRSDRVTDYVCGRSALLFERNAQFRRAMLASDPRPQYRAFVRHWVAGVVHREFPALFERLPPEFANGHAPASRQDVPSAAPRERPPGG